MTPEPAAPDQAPRITSRRLASALMTAGGLTAALIGFASAAQADTEETPDETAEGVVEFQVLGFNDFHGRLEESAVVMACAVEHYREQNSGNVILSAAGDSIGATTFTSFIQDDEPTIEALNAMGLDVSSLGNHEFDQGAADFDERVIPLSDFSWVGANARDAQTGEHLYEPYYIHEVDGVRVAFIGLNTEDMPRLVNPAGIDHIEWTSLSDEANYYAEYLTDNDLADVVTVVTHEGLPGGSLDAAEGQPFGELINNAHPSISAVFSGHTHQAYAHDVDGLWVGQGGEYVPYFVSWEVSYDTEADEIISSEMELVDLWPGGDPFCDSHPEVEQIVSDAAAVADELGSEVVAEVIGEIPFARAFEEDGEWDNRAAASTIGELVADAQLWAVQETNPETDFAITNSGGLRDDLPLGDVTIRDLGNVQPFANTLVVGTYTGDQVYQLFEQQWREDGRFSRHGQSENVFYTYDPQADLGERITGVWIDGESVDPDQTYQVAMNSYMAAGGDNLRVAGEALELHDTGQNDLEAFVDYGRELGTLEPDLARGGVGLHWITDEEATYSPGDALELDVSSLAYAHPDVPVGETLEVQLGETVTEEFEIDLTYTDDSDERGQAEVRLEVPDETGENGELPLVLTEPVTGTEIELSVQIDEETAEEAGDYEISEIVEGLDDHQDTGDVPVTTRGVVTGVYPSERSYSGFYIQAEGTGGQLDLEDHETSEAIFVYSPWTVGDEPGEAEVEIGDYVELTGDATVHEASGQKQISLYPGSDQTPHHELLVIEDEDFDPVVPAELEFPEAAEQRDSLLGMLIDPQGAYTVTDHFTLNRYGEIGIVAGEDPLFNPTSVVEPGESAAELAQQNRERLVYLDDGATNDFQNSDLELPYLTAEDPVRVGAGVEFDHPVIVHYDFGEYRLQPTTRLDGPQDPAAPASFENTRSGNEAPAERTADLRIAGFNVLNYFVHLGEDEEGCEYFEDREGNPTTTDWCDVRGAWSTEAFERQQAKIVAAINAMDADLVALQEVENSGHFHAQGDRDYAHARLVEALNEDLGHQGWDYVSEPDQVPPLEDEDVIRNGYIYKPEALEVTDSWILFDEGITELNPEHFEDLDRDLADIYSNAREPYAVEFQPVDGEDEDRFIAIVNHFKSKGASGVEDDDPNADQGDGQSPWNYDRIYQAQGVQAFADALIEATGTENVHLMGDFNSYEKEDPLQVFFDSGYTNLSAETGNFSYMFQAEVGSLDHLISSPAAAESVTHTEIWPINAVEPIALEYSRHNGSASDIFRLDQWRSSDHDPIVADIAFADSPAPPADEEEEDDAAPGPGEPTDPEGPPPAAEEGTGDGLAITGAAIGGVLLAALLLMGLGALVLRLSRRELSALD
ncbi:ExeM/NucH family extracellular endonuclease [Nesterenkonia muleiensis]|uniref:ExeM/NucH family extracellular endonuclease n=1 Tax=Nesterenkonia muleiensis TaxID=2282648 RepID=UPI000E72AF81|nr:ExeM/NucH family extracellular endonuclease [Nesterenkonia muleiensis]